MKFAAVTAMSEKIVKQFHDILHNIYKIETEDECFFLLFPMNLLMSQQLFAHDIFVSDKYEIQKRHGIIAFQRKKSVSNDFHSRCLSNEICFLMGCSIN